MRSRKALVLLVLIAFFGLLGCNQQLQEGRVIQKQHEAAREWVQLMMIPMSTGKTTTVTPVPVYHQDDEDFWVELEYCEENGTCQTERVYVSEERYYRILVGEYLVLGEGEVEYRDPTLTKRRQDLDRADAREDAPAEQIVSRETRDRVGGVI